MIDVTEILLSFIGVLIILLGVFSGYWFNRNNKQLELVSNRINEQEKELIRIEERAKNLKDGNEKDKNQLVKDISELSKSISELSNKWSETIELAKKTILIVKEHAKRIEKLEKENG